MIDIGNDSLHDILANDGFGRDGGLSLIFDDRHFNNVKTDRTIDHYVEAFKDTGIAEIVIIMKIRRLTRDQWEQMYRFHDRISSNSRRHGEDLLQIPELLAFQTLVGIPLSRGDNITAGNWTENDLDKILKNLHNIYYFIREMERHGIAISYRFYNAPRKRPFRGTYWIYHNRLGYVLDGSLGSIGWRPVNARKMTEKEYKTVVLLYSPLLIDDHEFDYPAVNERTLTNILEKITELHPELYEDLSRIINR